MSRIEPTREGGAKGPRGARPGAVHWLIRVAERAGLEGRESLDIPPGTPAREAWPVLTRAYSINDQRLAQLVGEYFRLDVAQLASADANAVLLIPEAMARKHHIYPIQESDRQIVVAELARQRDDGQSGQAPRRLEAHVAGRLDAALAWGRADQAQRIDAAEAFVGILGDVVLMSGDGITAEFVHVV